MPQLDKFTFAPQVFFLVLFFLVLYFLILSTGLPRLYKILLFRKKKLAVYNTEIVKLEAELFFLNVGLNNLANLNVKVYKMLPDVLNKILDVSLENVYNLKVKSKLIKRDKIEKVVGLSIENNLLTLNIFRLLTKIKFISSKTMLRAKILK